MRIREHTWRLGSTPLHRGAAHVWRGLLPSMQAGTLLLSDKERSRAERFRSDEERRRYVAAHAMLRELLSRYCGYSFARVEFLTGEHGKPSLPNTVGDPGLEFSLSHSGDLALVALSRSGAVGVDVEWRDHGADCVSLAREAFSPWEQSALRAFANEPRDLTSAFFDLWTRKEAYLKATGAGLRFDMQHFDVSVSDQEPARLIADRRDESAVDRWRIISIPVDDEYSAALTATTEVDEIMCFNFAENSPYTNG